MLSTIIIVLLLVFAPGLQAQNTGDRETEELFQSFRQVFSFVQDNYVEEVDPQVLMEGAMQGLFESLDDPYSAYLDATDLRSLNDTTSGEFGGVGLYINKVQTSEDQPELQEWVEIVSPIEGTPAYRAGLRPRDLIIAIEEKSTVELSIDEVVNRLRGEPNTVVQVTILRNLKTRFNVNLKRDIIVIPTVRYAGVQGNIGYLRIIQFTPRTAEKTKEAIESLQSQGFVNLIVDLRTNPGGLLNSAIDTADLFFNDEIIVGTSSRINSENKEFYATNGVAVPQNAQIAVLINSGTASAAEILAGALKNHSRAAIVGETSYGKGSVQQIRVLGDVGFRLTMSKYYTPGREFIDKIGISPDIEVVEDELSEAENLAITDIQNDNRIEQFLDRYNNEPTDVEIQRFISDLQAENQDINDRYLRRIIKLEIEARTNNPSVFDLDYDLVLQEAVDLLQQNRIQAIINNRRKTSQNTENSNAS